MKVVNLINDKGAMALIILLTMGINFSYAQEITAGFANKHTYLADYVPLENFWLNHYDISYRHHFHKRFSWNVAISSSQGATELTPPKERFGSFTLNRLVSFNNFDLTFSFNLIKSNNHRFSIMAGPGIRKRTIFSNEVGRISTLWNEDGTLEWHRSAGALDVNYPSSSIGIDETWDFTAIVAAEYMYYMGNIGIGYTFRWRHFEAASIGPLISYRFLKETERAGLERIQAKVNISNFQLADFGNGMAVNVGFNTNLTDKLFIYSGLGIYNSANFPDNVQDYETYYKYQAHFFETTLGYRFFQNSHHLLNFQAGPIFRIDASLKPLNLFFTETDLIFGFDASGENRYYLEVDVNKSNDFGASTAIEYEYQLNSTFSLGAQMRYNYFSENPVLQYGLGIGFKL